jgi:hypothetical protein
MGHFGMRGSEEGGTDNLQLSSEGGVFNCAEDGMRTEKGSTCLSWATEKGP